MYRHTSFYITSLYWTAQCCVFHKLKTRPSNSKRIMTGFIVMVWNNPTVSLSCALLKCVPNCWTLKLLPVFIIYKVAGALTNNYNFIPVWIAPYGKLLKWKGIVGSKSMHITETGLAQWIERQSADWKVPGSIPVKGMYMLWAHP